MADDLTEEEQSILRSELGELMLIARIARPGAIRDASSEAQTFTEWQIADFQIESDAISNTGD